MDTITEIVNSIKTYSSLFFHLSDIVDILIVAFIIYKLIMLIRKTSAARVAKALLFIIIVAWISGILGLNVLSYLLGKTMEMGFIAIIIMFQPELRHALERIGNGSLSSLYSLVFEPKGENREQEKAINHTVTACTDMAKQRIGALIVFERTMRLDEYVKTGTNLDATVSSELLKNIFFPKATLHDGAVIIRDCRIVAAGCVLPLSGNANLSRELGTRHRAGIGMSENSDAVVIIVSEESGTISVAVEGMLKRHLAPETLEKLLYNELIVSTDEETGEKGIMSRFFKVKKDEKDNSK